MNTRIIDGKTRLFDLTVEEFLALDRQAKSQPTEKTFPKVYGVKILQEKTGYSKHTIYTKTSRNEIPHTKRDGKLFFIDQEIDAWLTENRIETSVEYSRRMDQKLADRSR